MKTTVANLNHGDIIKFVGVRGSLMETPVAYHGSQDVMTWNTAALRVTKFLYLGEFRYKDNHGDVYRLFCDDYGREVRIPSEQWDTKVSLLDDNLEYTHTLRLTGRETGILWEAISIYKESEDDSFGEDGNSMDYDEIMAINLIWNRIKYLGGR